MKQKFDVTGMTCSACSAHVEKAVGKLEGIQTVNVNLLQNSMVVEYDDTALSADDIINAVKSGGYAGRNQQRHTGAAQKRSIRGNEGYEEASDFFLLLSDSSVLCFHGAHGRCAPALDSSGA